MTIESSFGQLGFTDNETKIYLALADVGKSTAQLIAKRVRIPRTTAYSVLESLVAKGLVSIEERRATTFYSTNNPSSLLRMVAQEKEEVLAKERLAKNLVEEVAPYFKSKHYSVPRLQFYEGHRNIETMLYDNFFEWQKSIVKYDRTWWGYQDHTFVESYMEWLQFHWANKLPDEMIYLFSNQVPVEERLKGKVKNREIRPVPAQFNFSSSIWIVGDFIILLMTAQQPHYAFQMHDSVFASNLRNVFQMLWFK